MKRRNFLQNMGAAALVPALPIKTIAAAAPAAAAPMSQHYLWGAFIARVHNKATPSMFARYFNVDIAEAQKVMAELVRDNVISMPDAAGVSHAVEPFSRSATKLVGAEKPFQSPSDPTSKARPQNTDLRREHEVGENDLAEANHSEDSESINHNDRSLADDTEHENSAPVPSQDTDPEARLAEVDPIPQGGPDDVHSSGQ